MSQRRIKKAAHVLISPLTLCLKDSKRGREQNTMHTFELCSTTKSVLPESVHWYFLNIPSDFFVLFNDWGATRSQNFAGTSAVLKHTY